MLFTGTNAKNIVYKIGRIVFPSNITFSRIVLRFQIQSCFSFFLFSFFFWFFSFFFLSAVFPLFSLPVSQFPFFLTLQEREINVIFFSLFFKLLKKVKFLWYPRLATCKNLFLQKSSRRKMRSLGLQFWGKSLAIFPPSPMLLPPITLPICPGFRPFSLLLPPPLPPSPPPPPTIATSPSSTGSFGGQERMRAF